MSGVLKTTIAKSACTALLAFLVIVGGMVEAKAATVTAVVKDTERNPIAGVKVYLCSFQSTGMHVEAKGETDADGRYTFPESEERKGGCGIYAFKEKYSWGASNYFKDKSEEVSIILGAPADLAGRVIDKEGRPVDGANVLASFVMTDYQESPFSVSKGSPFLTSSTDAEGKFLLKDLPDGARVAVNVDASGFATHKGDYNSPLVAPVDGVTITLNPESKIRGTVKHETTGKPAAGVTVSAQQVASRNFAQSVTEEDGSFEIADLNPGEYKIYLQNYGKDWGGVMVSPITVSVGEAQTVEDVAVLWTEGVIVEGRVLDAKTSKPVQHASAILRQADQPQAQCPSDAEGKFRIKVKPGSHVLSIHSVGFISPSIPLTVREDMQIGDIFLTKIEELVIKLQAPDGNPLKGVELKARNQTVATSDEQGLARIPENYVRSGVVEIVALSPDLVYGGMFSFPAKPENDLTWTLKKTGAITGVVESLEGEPLQGVEVRAHLIRVSGQGFNFRQLEGVPVAKTDAKGRYTLKGLPGDEEYGVEAEINGFGKNDPWNGTHYTVVGGATVEAEVISLMQAEMELTGRIVDPNGNGVQGVRISLSGQRDRHKEAMTNSEGEFSFKDLTRSEVNLTFQYQQNHGWRELMPEQFKDVVITVYPTPDFKAELQAGRRPPKLEDVEWVNGEWAGFESAGGSRAVVAFVSIGNPNSRDAISKLNSAANGSNGALRALLIHDSSATSDEIKAYLAENAIKLPTARVKQENESGWYSPVFTAWKVLSIPSITLIGTNGKIEKGNVPLQDLDGLK